jgi:Cytochrome oxidase complex assembly protein 1
MSDTAVRPDPKNIPAEIGRWNWGAFFLNWIWGIGNQTYIALLALIPGFGFIWMLVLGAKGNAWAWRNGRWDSVEHFRRVQRRWAIWGVVVWVVLIALWASLFAGIFSILRHSEAYQLGVAKLQSSPIAANLLGTPISTGIPSGSIKVDNDSGTASLSFSASGPRAAGVVSVEAVKSNGVWSVTKLTLKLNGSDNVINLVGGPSNST